MHYGYFLSSRVQSHCSCAVLATLHDDVIKWKHFPRYWSFVRGIHRWPVNSPHKGQWRGALMFSLICAWNDGWVNTREAGDLRNHRAHYYVIVMDLRPIRWFKLMPIIAAIFTTSCGRIEIWLCYTDRRMIRWLSTSLLIAGFFQEECHFCKGIFSVSMNKVVK